MNKYRMRILIAAAGLAAVPALASASDQQLAMDSCAKALVASIAAKSATPVKLRESFDMERETLITSHYEFMLVARRARDNAPLARALCRTGDDDQVVKLEEEPLSGPAF
jgi:hypothetical protein